MAHPGMILLMTQLCPIKHSFIYGPYQRLQHQRTKILHVSHGCIIPVLIQLKTYIVVRRMVCDIEGLQVIIQLSPISSETIQASTIFSVLSAYINFASLNFTRCSLATPEKESSRINKQFRDGPMLGNPRQSWILDSSFWIFWILVRGTWIPDFNLWRDSGFRELNSGFQSPGYQIPQGKLGRIPESLSSCIQGFKEDVKYRPVKKKKMCSTYSKWQKSI